MTTRMSDLTAACRLVYPFISNSVNQMLLYNVGILAFAFIVKAHHLSSQILEGPDVSPLFILKLSSIALLSSSSSSSSVFAEGLP